MNGARVRAVLLLAAVCVLAPLALAAARWPRYWEWIAPELTPMTWLQSVALVLAGAGCGLVALVLGRTGERPRWIWPLLGAGFVALAVDDRFALHERVRDGYLAPRGVTVPFLPWVAPGDFLILGVAVVGLALLPSVWRAMRPDRGATAALVVGVVLSATAVGVDSVDPATWSVSAERLQQSLEEVAELGGGLALLAAVALRLVGLLDAHLAPGSGGSRPEGAGTGSAAPGGGTAAGPGPTHGGGAGGPVAPGSVTPGSVASARAESRPGTMAPPESPPGTRTGPAPDREP
ncbi:hypothetical protein ACIBFB_06070 [Nocardiopsis sp. NPDC050513]|uniref:hypothetical protein n=1 Tax=Nocardiopsis sp. NPDC050513 TaxID=3364338 RepID=UPI0037A98C47